jgi:hypothetical protein
LVSRDIFKVGQSCIVRLGKVPSQDSLPCHDRSFSEDISNQDRAVLNQAVGWSSEKLTQPKMPFGCRIDRGLVLNLSGTGIETHSGGSASALYARAFATIVSGGPMLRLNARLLAAFLSIAAVVTPSATAAQNSLDALGGGSTTYGLELQGFARWFRYTQRRCSRALGAGW